MRYGTITSALLISMLLAGCATTGNGPVAMNDTFCLTSKKKMWSIEDSAETIHDARVHNEVIDRRCGVKRS